MTDVDVVIDSQLQEVIEIDPTFNEEWNLPIAAPSARGTWPRGRERVREDTDSPSPHELSPSRGGLRLIGGLSRGCRTAIPPGFSLGGRPRPCPRSTPLRPPLRGAPGRLSTRQSPPSQGGLR